MCCTKMWPGPPVLFRYSRMRGQLHDRSLPSPTSMFMILWKSVALLNVDRVLRCCAQVWAIASWLTQMWKLMNGSMPFEASFYTAETLRRGLLPYHLPYVLLITDIHSQCPSAHHHALISLRRHCQIQQAYMSAPLFPVLYTLTSPPHQNSPIHRPLSLHVGPCIDDVVMSLSLHSGLHHPLPLRLLSPPWPVALMLVLSSSNLLSLRMIQTLVSSLICINGIVCQK